MVPAPMIPNDDAAPLVALDALARGEVSTASRAIDDHVAKSSLGMRLRLMAAAAGHDLVEAQRLAQEVLARRNLEPALVGEARAVAALPEGRTLPREVLSRQLLLLLPDVLRHVLR
jgi:hypothetical protein